MKKLFFITLVLCLGISAYAQTGSACPGLKNPNSFTSGSTSGTFVGYYSGQTGTKPNLAPNSLTGVTGVNMTSAIIPASQLSNTTGNGGTSYCGSTIDPTKRFRIMSSTDGPGTGAQAGKDPAVNYALPYCPTPYGSDFVKSIRLGNCGINAEAEALYYTMNVRVQNALLFIYYSIVVQAPGHGPAGDPSFVIRVAKQQNGNWQQISDTLCYAVSSSGLVNGTNGWHSYSGSGGNGFYRDWNKVAINLNKYLYEQVRIEIYMGDCSASGHYGYCYVAGDCQPMEISTSGCPAGATQTVQTLTAPEGLDGYAWFKCNVDGSEINSLSDVDPSINFTALNCDSNVYNCTIEDFRILEGPNRDSLTNNMVFRCDMTSAMDPAKPFTSKVYVRVINTKPLVSIDTLKSCESSLRLTNKSYVPNDMMGCDTTITKWWFYSGANTNTPVADSAIGGTAYHTWDSAGMYAVKVRSFNRDDHECYTDSTYRIKVLGRPQHPTMWASDWEVCVNERVELRDDTPGSVRSDWYFDDEDVPNIPHGQTVQKVFNNAVNTVRMVTYNGLSARDSVDTHLEIQCTSEVIDTIKVFKDPEILYEGDTVICNGQSTNVTASTEEACSYNWYTSQDDSGTPVFTGQTLSVYPNQDSTTYYLLVTTLERGCKAWIPVTIHRVNPTLSISRHDMCEGDSVTLTSEKAFTYSWTASPADSSLDALLDSLGHGPARITVAPKETTLYTLVGHGTNDCSSSPLTEQITVHPVPVATVEMNPKFVDSDNPVVTFTDVSPYSVRRVWTFSEGTPEEYTSPCTHNFGEVSSDSVDITLAAYNDLECSDVLNFRIPVTQFTFYAPNVFTPERPDNNTFQIYTANEQENFSVFIYDRMGRLVYTSDDLHFKWNGNALDGTKLPQGAYAYVIYYRRPNTEDIVTQKGTVTLIR